ncbi:sugar ABC transporter substrate-binding protein [Brachybacterium sp. MASK1Z-5]|uniref:Sugar ABC transporter substrate-binding protein n=1 Tax=Brachybacterium halotolerans TaxID=2795215 RepID=A0ABS1B743_9MICO|nr:sugar ABC transporter substrate-binding protein [Brachybacterium halotolerans]MBK0330443.1 sugar ABC transporter substrate-binding protein [Brachybacterium halotolerans]
MISRRRMISALAATGAVGAAAACSPSGSGDSGSGSGSGKGGKSLTFRLWDDTAKAAYEKSFEAFEKDSGWKVSIDVVAWDDYWTKLPLDVASGDAPDVYLMNSANYVQFQEAGNLVAIDDAVDGADKDQWQKAVVDLYTRDGKLWGVPQLWDSIALFYNKELLDAEKIDPADLSFDPSKDSDPLREAGKALTVDKEDRHPGDKGFDADSRSRFGFNSSCDRQAIIGPFLASNGADWENDKDQYAFASKEGIATFQYLADLVNKDQIAPDAADTNENGDLCRDMFAQGKLALFQSGPYSLSAIDEAVGDSFEWGIAPMVAGPAGAKSLVHGVVAVGNAKADDDQQEGIAKLLTWLGSADGQRPFGEMGVSFPGNSDVQDTFVNYWKDKGQDVSVFIDAAKDPAPADTGAKANAGLTAAMPVFQEIFIGRKSAKDGLPEAQKAGNEAMK